MVCLEDWRGYILGAEEPFEAWSDHKNLEYFRAPQKVNRRQARWVSTLADYDFSLHHLPGAKNSAADGFSRQGNHDDGSRDNEDVVVLKQGWFDVRALETVEEGGTLEERVRREKDRGEELVEKKLREKPGEWSVDGEGTIRVNGKIYVPKDARLRGECETQGWIGARRNNEEPQWWVKH